MRVFNASTSIAPSPRGNLLFPLLPDNAPLHDLARRMLDAAGRSLDVPSDLARTAASTLLCRRATLRALARSPANNSMQICKQHRHVAAVRVQVAPALPPHTAIASKSPSRMCGLHCRNQPCRQCALTETRGSAGLVMSTCPALNFDVYQYSAYKCVNRVRSIRPMTPNSLDLSAHRCSRGLPTTQTETPHFPSITCQGQLLDDGPEHVVSVGDGAAEPGVVRPPVPQHYRASRAAPRLCVGSSSCS